MCDAIYYDEIQILGLLRTGKHADITTTTEISPLRLSPVSLALLRPWVWLAGNDRNVLCAGVSRRPKPWNNHATSAIERTIRNGGINHVISNVEHAPR